MLASKTTQSDRYDFVESIRSQSIFEQWLPTSKSYTFGNKLALNQNRDLFYAIGNMIRVCSINSDTKNYRVIKTLFSPFDISEIGLNSSGTFLYSTDYKHIIVQNFPRVFQQAKNVHVSGESYNLKGLDPKSKIVKIIWNLKIKRDLSLVVLEDNNTIKLYDLNVSASPRMVVNLNDHENFKGNKATSISFGSCSNLIGSLSLYITTESSKIFAIYPFVSRHSQICVSKEDIECSLDESYDIADFIRSGINQFNNDDLNVLIDNQINFFKSFDRQREQKPRKEVRIGPNGNEEIYHVSVKFNSCDHLIVQGPIANLKMGKIKDICDIGMDDDISIMLVINSDVDGFMVKYLAQLKPLIMAYGVKDFDILKNFQELAVSTEENSIPTTSSQQLIGFNQEKVNDKPYQAPRVGFGYVDDDLSSENEEELSTETSEERQSLQLDELPQRDKRTTQNNHPVSSANSWINNFQMLDTVGIDILDYTIADERKLIRSNIDPNRFLIYTSNKIIICTPDEWIETIVDCIFDSPNAEGTSNSNIEICTEYAQFDYNDNNASVVFVEDDLTYTGDYIISAFHEYNKPVELIKIREEELPPIQKLRLGSTEPPLNIESKIVNDLLPEIENELQQLKPINNIKFPIISSSDDSETLQVLNLFSSESLKRIQVFSNMLLRLNLKICTNLLEVKYQINLMNKLLNLSIDDSTKENISRVRRKQVNLNEQLKSLHNKLVKRIEAIKVYKQIPLSDEETKWFKEINQVTNMVGNNNTSNKQGLTKIIGDLNDQVEYIKKQAAKGKPVKGEDDLRYITDLRQIKQIVSDQWNSLSILKDDVDDLIESMEKIEA